MHSAAAVCLIQSNFDATLKPFSSSSLSFRATLPPKDVRVPVCVPPTPVTHGAIGGLFFFFSFLHLDLVRVGDFSDVNEGSKPSEATEGPHISVSKQSG